MSLKIVALGCIHGVLKKSVVEAIKREGPEAILVSGDFTGSVHDDEVRKYEKDLVENFGPISQFWPLRVQIDSEKKFARWGRIAAENTAKVFNDLDKLGIPLYYVHGNWDSVSTDGRGMLENSGDFFIDQVEGKNLKFIHEKVVKVGGFSVIGFGGYRGSSAKEYLIGDLPEDDPNMEGIRQVREDMRRRMERLFGKIKDPSRAILLTHDPPYKLHDYLEAAKKNYGEKVTREVIEKYEPAVCVCSHFHEHQGLGKIKKTLVVNSGYGREGQFTLIEADASGRVSVTLKKV
ncbi:MAG: metallophosphoesterase family protein [Candidatus Aenigmarchaeota archaeon]|nr:metallophosphoesterase family protein [Candidatus Aenigmarchaeota archaeon]